MQQDRNGKTTKSCSVPKSHPGKEQTVPENSTLTRPSIGSNRVTSSGQGHPLATSSSANCPKTSAGQNPTKFSAQSSSNCPKNVSKGQLHVPPRSNTPPPSVTMPTLGINSSLTPPTSLPSEPPPSSITTTTTTTIDKNTPSSSVTKTQQSLNSEEARKLRQAQQKLQKEKWQKKFSSSSNSSGGGGIVGVKVGVKRCSEGSLVSEGSSGGTSVSGRGQDVMDMMDGFAVHELISDGELNSCSTCLYNTHTHNTHHADDPEFWDRVLSSQECSSSSHHSEPGTNSDGGGSKNKQEEQSSVEGNGPQSKRFRASQ